MTNQYALQDPRTQYPQPPFPTQSQTVPGLASKLDPKPDHGEESYQGFGRLQGRKALITGADSGIGRAVAIAYAREGADLVLNYLDDEESDAREVVELTRPRWELEAQAKGVTYEFSVEGDAPPVAGRPEELREVLTNLISNAVDAMPAGGACRVRLHADGEWAVLAVSDTGVGMPEEMRRRVFEPFFTSKGPRGTGLGLAVSWGIVTRHGGTIEVESTGAAGIAFRVWLPVSGNKTSIRARATRPEHEI